MFYFSLPGLLPLRTPTFRVSLPRASSATKHPFPVPKVVRRQQPHPVRVGGPARARVHVEGHGVPSFDAGHGGLALVGEQGEVEGSWRRRWRRDGRGRVVCSGDTVCHRGIVGRLCGGATPAADDGGHTPPRPDKEVTQRGMKKIMLYQIEFDARALQSVFYMPTLE
jgi:hypothetical protein